MYDFPGDAVIKNWPANAGDTGDVGSILRWDDPLEEERATNSSILAWKIPWTVVYSPWGLKQTRLSHTQTHK